MHVNNLKCEQKATIKQKKKRKLICLGMALNERSAYIYTFIYCKYTLWTRLLAFYLAWLWRRITETSRKKQHTHTHIQIKGVCLFSV